MPVIEIPTFDSLWDAKPRPRPRVHPNGFIQLDLDSVHGKQRLHIWPENPLHHGKHPIHNHSFDMHSQVLCGALTNITYLFHRDPQRVTTVLHRAIRVPDTVNESMLVQLDSESRGYLTFWQGWTTNPGSSYSLPKEHLHDSIPHGLTVTIMTMTDVASEYGPVVAVPVGIEPDNEFRRDGYNPRILWTYIEKALSKATT
jgi:hypothetical protein